MPLLYLDPYCGISGDMFLGALLDLGAPESELRSLPSRLGLADVEIALTRVWREGLEGIHVAIAAEQDPPHRDLTAILAMIQSSDLPPSVKGRAKSAFQAIGEVEARLHGVPIEEIHFHEIGATDSILDIVGGMLLLESLQVADVHSAPPVTGQGMATMSHGILPIPAPATLRLLEGIPVRASGIALELVTPTGAALLRTLCSRFGGMPSGKIGRSGYGAGTREVPGRPNLLRALMIETTHPAGRETIHVLETHLDDVSPEVTGALFEILHAAGAVEVLLLATIAKKSRQGTLVHVLCHPSALEAVETALFRETGTLGIRHSEQERHVLDRRIDVIETPHGPLRVKLGFFRGEIISAAPEFEDCRYLAGLSGEPLRHFYALAAAHFSGLRSPK